MPLLISTSIFGLQFPILKRIHEILVRLMAKDKDSFQQDANMQFFHRLVDRNRRKRAPPFHRPLIDEPNGEAETTWLNVLPVDGQEITSAQTGAIDVPRLCELLQLDEEASTALEGTLKRLEKGERGHEPLDSASREERGVREL